MGCSQGSELLIFIRDFRIDNMHKANSMVRISVTTMVVLVLGASMDAESASSDRPVAREFGKSGGYGPTAFSHRLSGRSRSADTRTGGSPKGRGVLIGGDRGVGAENPQDAESDRLLGGPSSYEDNYQIGSAYEIDDETASRYEGTPLERLVSPATASTRGRSPNQVTRTKGQDNESPSGLHSSSSLKGGNAGVPSNGVKPTTNPYSDPFDSTESRDVAGRVYRSPW